MSESYQKVEGEDDENVSNDIINSVSQKCKNSEEENDEKRYSILSWTGKKKKIPFLNFSVATVLVGAPRGEFELIREYHMTFKFVSTECKIVRRILGAHGFKEAHPHSNNVNLLWSGGHFRPYTVRGLQDFQKANHFPRSFELTRKDKLYRNIQRMQQCKGQRHFDYVPNFFVLPSERSEFHSAFLKDKGPWIVKPVASSRGRGIYLIKDLNMLPSDEQVLVCRYIQNPLLVDGFKFDCRIYVAVTSFDPLTVYMYKEGLARFSTVKYEKNFNNIRNLWMHLTNYSIQKNNENYVRCDDPEIDNYGSKWSFSALLRNLKSKGIDTKALMGRIEDLIVKTMLSAEFSIGTACRMFVPYKNCCFELFGFDVLIDEDLKPWLLEVNLSPSLACESPLDLKIKANLLTDLFNLTGFIAKDPVTVKSNKRRNSFSTRGLPQRYRSLSTSNTDLKSVSSSGDARRTPNEGLSNEDLRMIREAKEEYKRRGKFVRIYPTPESWELYSSIQEHSSSKNKTLHSALFPELWSANHQRPLSAKYMARARGIGKGVHQPQCEDQTPETAHGMAFQLRYQFYEKKLDSWDKCLGNDVDLSQKENSKLDSKAPETAYEQALLCKKREKHADFDLAKVISNGDCLSKLQAREAFATYLERVQARLVQDISASQQRQSIISFSTDVKQEEQMNLILRFLKRAAASFRHPMAIISPAKSLPILEKQRMLVRQLKEFIATYRKETVFLSDVEKMNTKKSSNDIAKQSVSNDVFHLFITIASENELEELLSVFTKSNKAASIFLGEPEDDGKKQNQQCNGAQRVSQPKITKELIVPRSSWKDLLSKRESHLEPAPQKYDQPLPAFRAYGATSSAGLKQRPVSANFSANLLGCTNSHVQHRPSSAIVTSSKSHMSTSKSKPQAEQKHGDEKLNNHLANKKAGRRIRHSSAPSQQVALTNTKNRSAVKGDTIKKEKQNLPIRNDADMTFESFVKFDYRNEEDIDNGKNDTPLSKGIPTAEQQNQEDRETYFRSRESKRIDSAVKKAQKVYYETYLKELQHDTKALVPHPPSQRPGIKKSINTNRINRLMVKPKSKD